MNDPYAVLGVSSSASEEEIKRAYRDLVKKYHPDNYANNPLADLAEAKMKEVNEAYDAIMKARTHVEEALIEMYLAEAYPSDAWRILPKLCGAARCLRPQSVS